MQSFVGTRPDDDTVVRYTEAWEHSSSEHPEVQQMLLSAASPDVEDFIRNQFIAACHLEECLLALGAPETFRKEWCFKYGQLCFGRDIWDVFDRVIARCEAQIRGVTERQEWVDVPVPQDVPELTDLVQDWWGVCRRSADSQGVYPQQCLVGLSDDTRIFMAMAMDGNEAFHRLIELFRRPDLDITECIFGIDMTAMAGQGLEFNDFLAVVWFREETFYTGVLNYTVPEEGEPIFREIDWTNNYWNHSLRDFPIPDLKQALVDRVIAITRATPFGAPPLPDLPFEELTILETARLIDLMPDHLRKLLFQWGWEDTVLRDGLFGWLLSRVWEIGPHQYFATDETGEHTFKPYREFLAEGTRIKLDLNTLEQR